MRVRLADFRTHVRGPNALLAVKLHQIAPTGIRQKGTRKSEGAAIKVSLKPFHGVCLASAVVFVVVLIVGGTLSAPPRAATNATVQQSQCMRRVIVTSKPCGATIYIMRASRREKSRATFQP
jgi:hypothetical protein